MLITSQLGLNFHINLDLSVILSAHPPYKRTRCRAHGACTRKSVVMSEEDREGIIESLRNAIAILRNAIEFDVGAPIGRFPND